MSEPTNAPVEQDSSALPQEASGTEPPPERKDELDGEDQKSLVGIMYSERSWIVPTWTKVAFFWFAIALIGSLGWFEVDKRVTFRRLLVDSVVEPTPLAAKAPNAPEVRLKAGEGGPEIALSQFRGKWVVLNFWATWCPPCRDEMPSMEMLNRRMTRDHPDKFAMVAISVDEDWNEVGRFFAETKPTFTVLWDRTKTSAFAYSTRKFPETYLIAPDGTVAAKFIGPRDWYNQAAVQYFDEVVSGKRKPT